MCSMSSDTKMSGLKCQDLNVIGLDARAVLIYIGLDAVITRELPHYIDCTVHQ